MHYPAYLAWPSKVKILSSFPAGDAPLGDAILAQNEQLDSFLHFRALFRCSERRVAFDAV